MYWGVHIGTVCAIHIGTVWIAENSLCRPVVSNGNVMGSWQDIVVAASHPDDLLNNPN